METPQNQPSPEVSEPMTLAERVTYLTARVTAVGQIIQHPGSNAATLQKLASEAIEQRCQADGVPFTPLHEAAAADVAAAFRPLYHRHKVPEFQVVQQEPK